MAARSGWNRHRAKARRCSSPYASANVMTKPHYKVLIVDDSREDRAICKRRLQRDPDRSYTIWEEELSRKGLVTYQIVRPDCVLLDYQFPDIDGLQFLSQLRVLAEG